VPAPSASHETPDRRPVASRLATWEEVRRLVGVMGDMNAGIFELAGEAVGRTDADLEGLREYHGRLRALAVETGRPVTFGLFSRREAPGIWHRYLDLLEETAAAGGRMFAQVHSRALTVVLSFRTNLPFDRLPVWRELRVRPLDEQRARLREPELRRHLVEAAREREERRAIGAEARPAAYQWIFVMDTVEGPHRSVAEVARERGVDPVEAMIDLALEKDLDRFFLQPIANENQEHALDLIKHPRTVVTFSDSGAHVSQIMDASLQTHLLAHWVRARQALTLEQAVRMLSFDTATAWGFADRGLIREGFAADLVVFDPDSIGPAMPDVVHDLPAGARRLVQRARGIAATVVNGEVVLRDGKPTGALPGRLLRGPLAARS
jgi:N-acyl-D-amino-acid deacylase